ncbi:hypothetical protein [Legionella nagasakiensis]|uniref:hypothetical protein n=1 Tax=Legionella nagasakiensis TaxID=535290 RepID=UPI0010569E2E|nr:hypothetical protein [Legionella nagasakiensis]
MMNKKITMYLLIALSGSSAFAEITTKSQEPKANVQKSLSDYPVCKTEILAQQLDKQFTVVYLKDELANYNYYLIKDSSELNADNIRKAVCEFILNNNCYLYWGNVANLAILASKKAAWFPADTSPHYMLSPIITCNKAVKTVKTTPKNNDD